MDCIRWSYRPSLHQPVVVAAFEGWNDAGDAATSAVQWFADRWDATPFADIDPEEFYDFTSTRPEVRIEDGERVIDWPENEFLHGRLPGSDRDVVLFVGVEPQLRWRTFCEAVLGVCADVDASMVVTLGALLAEVPHSRDVGITGTSGDPELRDRLSLIRSRYEGPTGIVGVLHDQVRRTGMGSASLWATVPSYIPGAPSPKATLALVERTAALLDVGVMTTDLEIASASYERQIDELVADDEETQAYVAALEARHDQADEAFTFDDEDEFDEQNDEESDDDGGFSMDVPSDPTEFIEQVERFLRDGDG